MTIKSYSMDHLPIRHALKTVGPSGQRHQARDASAEPAIGFSRVRMKLAAMMPRTTQAPMKIQPRE
jgi:hypothetical protein